MSKGDAGADQRTGYGYVFRFAVNMHAGRRTNILQRRQRRRVSQAAGLAGLYGLKFPIAGAALAAGEDVEAADGRAQLLGLLGRGRRGGQLPALPRQPVYGAPGRVCGLITLPTISLQQMSSKHAFSADHGRISLTLPLHQQEGSSEEKSTPPRWASERQRPIEQRAQ